MGMALNKARELMGDGVHAAGELTEQCASETGDADKLEAAKEAQRQTGDAAKSGASAGVNVITSIGEKCGVPSEEMEDILMGRKNAPAPMTLKVRAKTGIGA